MLFEAEKRGIHKDRLIFAKRLPIEEYLSSYKLADLFLDTFNYSAGSTAVCALWGGVPLLTLCGETNSSRMGASILHAAELDEFICLNKEDYLNKAVQLSKQPDIIAAAKLHLNQNKEALALFNLSNSVHSLEVLFIDTIHKF